MVHEAECEFEGGDEPAPGRVRWRTLLSSDRTPTDALTLGVAEIDPGGARDFRPHRHAQPEAYYILSGEGVVSLAGTDHPVRPGTTVFIPGNVAHGARNTGSERLRLLYVFPADSFGEIRYEFPST
jgi:mannose-6-phosphate isomerase-like protein (cupin superfamily)